MSTAIRLRSVSTENLRAELRRREEEERKKFEREHRRIKVLCRRCEGNGRINFHWDPCVGSDGGERCPECCNGKVTIWVSRKDPRVKDPRYSIEETR